MRFIQVRFLEAIYFLDNLTISTTALNDYSYNVNNYILKDEYIESAHVAKG